MNKFLNEINKDKNVQFLEFKSWNNQLKTILIEFLWQFPNMYEYEFL